MIMHNGPLLCAKIMDRKQVMFLSTEHSMTPVAVGRTEGEGESIKQPEVIHAYKSFPASHSEMVEKVFFYYYYFFMDTLCTVVQG